MAVSEILIVTLIGLTSSPINILLGYISSTGISTLIGTLSSIIVGAILGYK
jgi:hypothetical protein